MKETEKRRGKLRRPVNPGPIEARLNGFPLGDGGVADVTILHIDRWRRVSEVFCRQRLALAPTEALQGRIGGNGLVQETREVDIFRQGA